MTLPDGNPVWIQANAKGERYVPFRLDIKNSKSTWTGSLPHDRADQVDAQITVVTTGGYRPSGRDIRRTRRCR